MMSRFLYGGIDDGRKFHLMDWDTVTNPIEVGGLSISLLLDLNDTLIAEQIYKFTNEIDNLCRKVVCTRSQVDLSRILMVANGASMKSTLINLIGSLIDRNDNAFLLAQQGFRLLIGNGVNMDF